jgi:hypothetical protein
VLSLVVVDGVAKLPDQFLSFFLRHFRFQSIDDSDVGGFGLVISFGGFRYQFGDAFQFVAELFLPPARPGTYGPDRGEFWFHFDMSSSTDL